MKTCAFLFLVFLILSCDLSEGSDESTVIEESGALGYRPVTVVIKDIETDKVIMKSSYAYGSNGYLNELVSISNEEEGSQIYTYTYDYDNQNRLTSITKTLGEKTSSLTFSYNEKEQLSFFNGTQEYRYNDQGQMTTMISKTGKTEYLYVNGRLVEWYMFNNESTDPIISSIFRFDEHGQLHTDELYDQSYKSDGSTLIERYTYNYSDDGNVTHILYGSRDAPGETRRFLYDENNCLTEATLTCEDSGDPLYSYKDYHYSFSET